MLSEVPIAAITVGARFRKDTGDLTELAASIEALGLLHPIGITHDRELVYGLRRLRACERAGLETVTARVVYLDDPLRAERDENACRKDFAPSELVAIGRAIEEREREKARARQATSTGGKNPVIKPEVKAASEKVTEAAAPAPRQPPVRDIAAAAVGVSGPTYARAKAVVEAAEREPALAPVVEAMDRTGNVSAAYRAVQTVAARAGGSSTPSAPSKKPVRTDAGIKWYGFLHDIYATMNSIRDIGGVLALAKEWTDRDREQFVAQLEQISERTEEWITQLKEGE